MVNFYEEKGVSKFSVGVNCIGTEEIGNIRYEIQGRVGDEAILIETVVTKESEV